MLLKQRAILEIERGPLFYKILVLAARSDTRIKILNSGGDSIGQTGGSVAVRLASEK